MSAYTVRDLCRDYGRFLQLELIVGEESLDRPILAPEILRPGLALTGYVRDHPKQRILVFGRLEIDYTADLESEVGTSRVEGILFDETPTVILARGQTNAPVLIESCARAGVPIFSSPLPTPELLQKLGVALNEAFAPTTTRHGTLVEVFGVGILIEGEAGVGKSEAGLGLLERGHRLISDDVVQISKEDDFLRGKGGELTRHHMEIRGIGIIDVARLYGAVCVRECKRIDLVARIEEWDDEADYDRVGLDEARCAILDISLPYHRVPVKPGRDVVLLLETIALKHRLKAMGRCPAREFSNRLTEAIEQGVSCTN